MDEIGLAARACGSGIGQSPCNSGVPWLNVNKTYVFLCNMSYFKKLHNIQYNTIISACKFLKECFNKIGFGIVRSSGRVLYSSLNN